MILGGSGIVFDPAYSRSTELPVTNNTLDIGSSALAYRTLYLGTSLVFTATTSLILTNTSDGSDNKQITIGGGGAANSSQGAYFEICGNERSSRNGLARIVLGDTASSRFQIFLSNASALAEIYNSSSTVILSVNDSGEIISGATDFTIRSNTSDGADSKRLILTGGGVASATRGAYAIIGGNEHGSNAGQFQINTGNISGTVLDLVNNSSNGSIRLVVSSGSSVAFTVNSSSNLVYGATSCSVIADTTDASDTKALLLCGGGANGSSRGGNVEIFGNENANTGKVILRAGNISGGTVDVATQGVSRWSFLFNGDLSGDSTNGNDIIFQKAGAGLAFQMAVNLAAGGTNQSDATAIVSRITHIGSASGNNGVKVPVLRAAAIGDVYFVINKSGATVKIYPQSGENIDNAGANNPVNLDNNERCILVSLGSGGQWYTFITVAA